MFNLKNAAKSFFQVLLKYIFIYLLKLSTKLIFDIRRARLKHIVVDCPTTWHCLKKLPNPEHFSCVVPQALGKNPSPSIFKLRGKCCLEEQHSEREPGKS